MFFAQNRFVACSKEISSGSSDDDFRYTAASDVTTDSDKYHQNVIVERIYYNFQTDEEILQGNGKFMLSAKMRHVVTTGNKTVSIPLPFNPSDSEAIRAPKWNTKFKDYSHLF